MASFGVSVDFITEAATPEVTQLIEDGLDAAFKGMSSQHVKVERTGHLDAGHPDPMVEGT